MPHLRIARASDVNTGYYFPRGRFRIVEFININRFAYPEIVADIDNRFPRSFTSR